jgi:hypothetical protein
MPCPLRVIRFDFWQVRVMYGQGVISERRLSGFDGEAVPAYRHPI